MMEPGSLLFFIAKRSLQFSIVALMLLPSVWKPKPIVIVLQDLIKITKIHFTSEQKVRKML